MHPPSPSHSLTFSKTKFIASSTNFYHLIPLIRFFFPPAPPPKLINFIPATLTEICKLISAFESKQCLLDSIPTFFLKLCSMNLVQSSQILSFSFWGNSPIVIQKSSCPASSQKLSLSTDDLHNFRLISNPNFISKILEKNYCCFPHSISQVS